VTVRQFFFAIADLSCVLWTRLIAD